ncbi:hypothetical protein B23_3617 [Geobacillus thermoleovorans B23]|nr:hypothetical protein B23_3617 [Geobacillus thermoleovorans B23]
MKVIDRIFETCYAENSSKPKSLMEQAFLGFLSYL